MEYLFVMDEQRISPYVNPPALEPTKAEAQRRSILNNARPIPSPTRTCSVD